MNKYSEKFTFNLKIGKCIYCGDSDSLLTREHIMPRGLGGNEPPSGQKNALVLQDATCEMCRKITQGIEDECLRHMMDSGRARLGLKRKDRATATMKTHMDFPDGSNDVRDVSTNEILGAIILPSYYEAGVLTDAPINDIAPCDYQIIVVAPAGQSLLQKSSRVGVELTANSKTFAQMLAKIALGMAVAKFGIDGFTPLVQDFIRHKPNQYGHWVGGFAGMNIKTEETNQFHQVHLKTVQANAGIFIIVEICLFAEFGGPTNYVVVGKPLD
jgi:hypothetical protein